MILQLNKIRIIGRNTVSLDQRCMDSLPDAVAVIEVETTLQHSKICTSKGTMHERKQVILSTFYSEPQYYFREYTRFMFDIVMST